MARIPMAFELMKRAFKLRQDAENAVGITMVAEVVPVTVLAVDATHVWVKLPLDAIMSFALAEDSPDVQQD